MPQTTHLFTLPDIAATGGEVYAPVETTELLARVAALAARPGHRVLELGTGTGIVAIAVAKAVPEASVTASDINPAAVEAAALNAACNHVVLETVSSDWFAAFEGRVFDLILSHPPAIPYPVGASWGMTAGMTVATNGGRDGSDASRFLLSGAARYLAPGGAVLLALPHWCNVARVMAYGESLYRDVSVLARGAVRFFPLRIATPDAAALAHHRALAAEKTVEIDFSVNPPVSPVSIVRFSNPI